MLYKAFIQSWKNIRITILLVYILSALVTLLFVGLFLVTSGIWDFLISQPLTIGKDLLFTAGFEFKTFVQQHVVKIILSFIAFFIPHFVIGSSITALRYGILKDIADGKKQGIIKGLIQAIPHAQKKYWSVVWMRALTFLIIAVFTGIVLFVNAAVAESSMTVKIISLIIALLASLILAAILLFRYAYVFISNAHALTALLESASLFIRKPFFVLGTLGIIILMNLIRTGLEYLPKTSLFAVGIALTVLIYAVLLLLWQDLFIFTVFKHRTQKNL